MPWPPTPTTSSTENWVTTDGPSGMNEAGYITSQTLVIDGPVTQHIVVGSDGSYRAVVPAGTYTVTGASPQYNDGASNCRTDSDTVTLAAGQTVAADVICSEK
jgi:hypothetical protein